MQFVHQPGSPDEYWLPRKRRWQDAGDSWLVAHDLYHHYVEDTGTLEEELASLGAEYYICFEEPNSLPTYELTAPPGLNAMQRSAASIVGITWDAGAAPRKFRIEPCPHEPKYPLENPLFIEGELSAAYELTYLAGEPSNSRDPWYRAVKSFTAPGTVASWINKGYFDARYRFPNQIRVREAFNELITQLNNLHCSLEDSALIQVNLEGELARVTVRQN